MFPWARYAGLAVSPSERFTTTYNSDFKPFHQRKTFLKPIPSTKPGAVNMRRMPERDTSAMLLQHYYMKNPDNKTSLIGPQYPPNTLFPVFIPSLGGIATSFTEEIRNSGCLKDAAPWHNVYGERAGLLKRQMEDPSGTTDIHYEEGVIVLSPYRGPIKCEDVLQILHKTATPTHMGTIPRGTAPYITLNHATGVTGGNLTAVSQPAVYPEPCPGQAFTPSSHYCSNCGSKSEHPLGCCCGAQLVPPHVCQSGGLPHPVKRPPMTEYQDSYSAKWFQPKIKPG
ncbi:uncharacterized protein LOC129373340 [Poeciliopsis prolifica]|uniref:uncharacterized protein LOC129373340 n=1 Tax=Poeciliopsis prolifica TaxID=188132 RepID=UPI0024132F6A|nr:uncharacterized protein LOC129373340 [Poeciliopsis prolifica]